MLLFWLASFVLFGFCISSPWAWLAEILFTILILIISFRTNNILGSLISILAVVMFIAIVRIFDQFLCWDLGVPDEETNQMVDVSYLSEEERQPYIFMYDNYQPGQKMVLGKGWKATLDCLRDDDYLKIFKTIFTQNW